MKSTEDSLPARGFLYFLTHNPDIDILNRHKNKTFTDYKPKKKEAMNVKDSREPIWSFGGRKQRESDDIEISGS